MDFNPLVHRALAADSRVDLLRALTDATRPLSALELADDTGLHLTTVRSHLGVLIEAGLVESEAEARTTPGRPRILYRARGDALPDAPGGSLPDAPGGYRLLAEILTGHMAATTADTAEQARTAGVAWGRYLVGDPPPFVQLSTEEVRTKVVEMFATLGFEPQLSEEGDCMFLRRCPFLDLARRHPEVVCSLHHGLLEGALQALGAPFGAGPLDALVEPSLCVAHLNGDRAV